MAASVSNLRHPFVYSPPEQSQFYSRVHYSKDYDVSDVHEILNTLPSNVSISAQSPFVPHLVLRDHIYQFPIISNAQYIVLSPDESSYPMGREAFDHCLDTLDASFFWEPVTDRSYIKVYRRR